VKIQRDRSRLGIVLKGNIGLINQIVQEPSHIVDFIYCMVPSWIIATLASFG
jgi:hypothetical protein